MGKRVLKAQTRCACVGGSAAEICGTPSSHPHRPFRGAKPSTADIVLGSPAALEEVRRIGRLCEHSVDRVLPHAIDFPLPATPPQ